MLRDLGKLNVDHSNMADMLTCLERINVASTYMSANTSNLTTVNLSKLCCLIYLDTL